MSATLFLKTGADFDVSPSGTLRITAVDRMSAEIVAIDTGNTYRALREMPATLDALPAVGANEARAHAASLARGIRTAERAARATAKQAPPEPARPTSAGRGVTGLALHHFAPATT